MPVYTLTSSLVVGFAGRRVRVELFERSGGYAANTQDSSLVTVLGDRLRVAAIDGVTPTARTLPVAGVDGAVWAAGVARTLLLGSDTDLATVAEQINGTLHDSTVTNSRDQRQTALSAADISIDDSGLLEVSFLQAADCCAWALDEHGWHEVLPTEAREPGSAVRVDAWLAAHPNPDQEQRYAMEEAELGRPEHWRAAALGRFPVAKVATATARRARAVLLASDGVVVPASDPMAALTVVPHGSDGTVLHVSMEAAPHH